MEKNQYSNMNFCGFLFTRALKISVTQVMRKTVTKVTLKMVTKVTSKMVTRVTSKMATLGLNMKHGSEINRLMEMTNRVMWVVV